MLWVADLGRTSRTLPSQQKEEAWARLTKYEALRDAAARWLDTDASDFTSDPDLWVSKPVKFGPLVARPGCLVSGMTVVEEEQAVILRGDPAEGYDPTRVVWNFDVHDNGYSTVTVVARWDSALQMQVPRVALGPATSRMRNVMSEYAETILDELFDGLNAKRGDGYFA